MNNDTSSAGIGFIGLLTIVFIVLKLTHFISWSWWFVLMPLYLIPMLIIGGILIIATVIPLIDKKGE